MIANMRGNALENSAKFFYDCAKVSFAVLVIGVMAQKPFVTADLIGGVALTLTLFLLGVILDQF